MKQFFQDDQGHLSSARLTSFLIILNALFVVSFQVTQAQDIDHVMVIELLGAGLGLKMGSRFQEQQKKSVNGKVD
ncbi:MAG: hypothetical protein EP346_00040 [Bacteroidetes bacterium]|nr:MAG: hypothetical protein EP346_00040 [Bacteroidota bacterium]